MPAPVAVPRRPSGMRSHDSHVHLMTLPSQPSRARPLCLPQVKGKQEGRMSHPSQYLGGFDLVSTAAAPPGQVREHRTLLPRQAGLHLTPPLLQDDGGCRAGGRCGSRFWSVTEACLPTHRRPWLPPSPSPPPHSGPSKEAALYLG